MMPINGSWHLSEEAWMATRSAWLRSLGRVLWYLWGASPVVAPTS